MKKDELKELVASLNTPVPPLPEIEEGKNPTEEQMNQALAHIGRTNYNKALLDVISLIEEKYIERPSNLIIPR